ncbi:hypothetical protein STRIP9103_07913, partial [Streptomyces ipomoeae 91-03]
WPPVESGDRRRTSPDGRVPDGPHRAPHHHMRPQQQMLVGRRVTSPPQRGPYREAPQFLVRDVHGGERRVQIAGEGDVVVPDQGHIAGHREPRLVQGGQGAGRDHVGGRHHRRELQPGVQRPPHQPVAGVPGEVAGQPQRGVGLHAPGAVGGEVPPLAALGGGVVGLAAEEQDPPVAMGQDVRAQGVRAALVVVLDDRDRCAGIQRRPSAQHEP